MSSVPATSPSTPLRTGPCDPTDEVTVARLMAAIAAGNQPAIWALRELADVPIRSRVRGELRRLGVRYDAEDLDGMVIDAVLAIADIAGSWRPGGAPPWSWAHHRVVGVVHRWVGTFADSLDDFGAGDSGSAIGWLESHRALDHVAPGDSGRGVDPSEVISDTRAALRRAATGRPVVAALDAALSELASTRDAAVWLAVLEERESGNPSPAITVGARFGMRPDAVRKAVQRVWQRLLAASADERFAALAQLPVVAARGRLAA